MSKTRLSWTLTVVVSAMLILAGCSAATKKLDRYPTWWNDAVFYEIFVRSFADSQSGPLANDGIGDLQGIIENLDYLNDGDPATDHDLGITGIWLMPIMQSPSYHGYDVEDYLTVEEDYGTNDDFKRLVNEAHKRGIRVIVDMVLNHASIQNPVFDQADDVGDSKRDWFVWESPCPDYDGPWGQQVWHQWDDACYYGVFSSVMPDWNLENADATRLLHDYAKYWITEMGVDGFRLDAIRYLVVDDEAQSDTKGTHEWLAAFQAQNKALSPHHFNVGEVWAETLTTSTYGRDEVDVTFQFELADELIKAVNYGLQGKLPEVIDDLNEKIPDNQYATFLSNHDQVRVMTLLGNHDGRGRTAAGLLLTLPGVPFVYYGEEYGKRGRTPDPDLRTPMAWSDAQFAGFSTVSPWSDILFDYSDRNVKSQTDDPDSLLSSYRHLIHLRNDHECLRRGVYRYIGTNEKRALTFRRTSEYQSCVIVINLNRRPIEVLEIPSGTELGTLAFSMSPDLVRTNTGLKNIAPHSVQIFVQNIARTEEN